MSKFNLGQRVRVVIPASGHEPNPAYIGEEGTIVACRAGNYNVHWDNAESLPVGNHGTWREEVLIDAERHPFGELESWERDLLGQPQRPALTLTKETSRRYAADADSKVLDGATREILQKAAAGEPVDAYAFNAALTHAMSAAATRFGQSPARRRLTSKIRHLAYIAQAVIENHADNLPAYEQGERSRLVKELRGEISTLTMAASAERRRLCREIDDHRAVGLEQERRIRNLEGTVRAYADNAGLQDERINALIREKTEAEIQVEDLREGALATARALDNGSAVLNYALSLLSVADRARVEGYADRVSEEG